MKKLLIVVMALLLMLSGCIIVENDCPDPTATTPVESDGSYELFEVDTFALLDKKEIDSTQITVDGVRLGDNFQTMQEKLGTPQVIDEFLEDNVVNAKYETEDGATAYIFHFQDDKITRIVIRPGLNPRLPEGSKVDMELAEITSTFGKPDHNEDIVLANSGYRVYYYYDLGLEIYHARKDMIGYALVTPGGSSVNE